MGLFLRKNGYYYVELELHGRKVQRSLKTKSSVFAKDLYHVIFREKLLKELFPEASRSVPMCRGTHGWVGTVDALTSPVLPQNSTPQSETTSICATPLHVCGSLEGCYRDYLKDCISRGLGRRSMEDKNRFIKILKRHKLADFSKITAEGVNRFWYELQKHYAQDTIRKIASDLKSFLNYAIRQEAFTESALRKLTFPKISVKVREAVYTDEQWEAIQKLASKDKDFLLYLKTLYYTGCRPSEIVSLHRKDIDNQGNARIFQNKVKTKKTVSIPPFLLKDMGEAYIFKGHDRQPEYYGKKFRKLRLKLGLSTEYSLYTFRHTFGTRLLNKTGDIHLVSKALGHSNIMMTSKHYANRTDKDIQERVASALWPQQNV